MTKTKINFRLSKDRKAKRCIGCLDVETGEVTNAKDSKKRNIEDIKKYDNVGYFATHKNGKKIQDIGEYKS